MGCENLGMRVVTFKVEEDLLIMLDSYAYKHKMNRSEAIRKAIKTLVEEDLKKEVHSTAKVDKIKLL